MSYRVAIVDGVGREVGRAAREQVRKALGEISSEKLGLGGRVHQVRKRLKKVRSALRLLRPRLRTSYAAENAHFRDLGRLLAPLREADAAVETLGRLAQTGLGKDDGRALGRLLEAAVRRRDELTSDDARVRATLEEARLRLADGVRRIAAWEVDGDGFDEIGAGLAKTYRQARSAGRAAASRQTAEAFHEFRKRGKDHWRHVGLLRDVWPTPMKARAHELHALGDLLGDDHDLSDVVDLAERIGVSEGQADLLEELRLRSANLRERADSLRIRLFAEKPKRFRQRCQTLWNAPPLS
ncbi:MAG: CHAD domain-containing protein [Acidobacteria bacterium]|nr:CHAD domain-containing protein [Acidobacteriota bacterium]